MIIVMAPWATSVHIDDVVVHIRAMGFESRLVSGENRNLIAVEGGEHQLLEKSFEAWPGVERVIPVLQPFKLASREYKSNDTVVLVGADRPGLSPITIGGPELHIIAGPCAVENEKITLEIAQRVKAAGCRLLRGGAFKPRTSPYSFQGLGEGGLRVLEKVRAETGLFIVTEVLETSDIEIVSETADVLQVGTRNMSNFRLLQRLGTVKKPVLLKRGMNATIKEFLMAAEYILSNGNPNVILCERGIRTFETYTRFTVDINAIPAVKHLSHLPIIVDPSHGTGVWRLVEPVALAGIAAGADGLLIEVHSDPQHALSDGSQALKPERLPSLLKKVQAIGAVLGRTFSGT
ncbi:MAG: 3-deoxy-7-phosphoheptulonate synthase [Candidatus Riflebacteria bacterium]|nr:3-deoxy-7-phosphoheptulonate synthase [Candidatus Riflebacteria bacterium]